jgi:amidase
MKRLVFAAAAVAAVAFARVGVEPAFPAGGQAPRRGAEAAFQTATAPARRVSASFTLVEASIPDIRAALEQHRITSVELVTQYLTRVALYEDRLHAALTVNPNALKEAAERDDERAAGRVRGPLHGIPIAVKDNIHTTDMPTTGGALVFDGFVPPYEATLVRNLREGGAIVIAKTGMTELANWVAGAPTPMPTNYNALGGYGFNPFDPRRDPRPATFDGRPALATGGSSSGVGTSANFWAGNVGTETSGSILSPSNQNMLAGIKPTVGRVSRYGVIPITADQDTPGPMAKWVSDVAIMLGVLEGARPDPNDPATERCSPPPNHDYTPFLQRDGLKGARIGIPRAYFYDRLVPPAASQPPATANVGSQVRPEAGRGAAAGNQPAGIGGLNAEQAKVMAAAIAVMRAEGAVIVDPANIPSIVDPDAANNFLRWNTCSGVNDARGKDEDCSVVFKYGMKRDFNAWLRTLGPKAPVKSLTELRNWNLAHKDAGAIKYGQSNLDISDEMNVERDRARYDADRAKDLRLAATHGIDEVMKAERLDVLVFPGSSGAGIAARPGYPTVIVPFGMVPNAPTPPFPAGFDAKPQPFGVSFTGMACGEPKLLSLAYAFEQATKRRNPPPGAP